MGKGECLARVSNNENGSRRSDSERRGGGKMGGGGVTASGGKGIMRECLQERIGGGLGFSG